MKRFKFSQTEKALFYFFYLYYFIRIPLDLKSNRVNVLVTESIWIGSKILKFRPFLLKSLSSSKYKTKFGVFNITPDLISTIAVSPSFERREIETLLRTMGKDIKSKKHVLFIDVGAFFGLYTIAVGNKFKRFNNLEIIAFEPGTSYLSLPTNSLLKRNVKENKLKNVKIYNFGLGSSSKPKDNLRGIKTKRLEEVISLSKIRDYDSIFMKIDVDGDEESVLKGSKDIIRSANKLTLLIEDFVDPSIIRYLKKDFVFLEKPSVYNSFWIKK